VTGSSEQRNPLFGERRRGGRYEFFQSYQLLKKRFFSMELKEEGTVDGIPCILSLYLI
jgi:hypothetical protein